jgi:immune inhibitor A
MLNNTLTRNVTLPTGSAALTFDARYDIEDCGSTPCDYAYVEASLDNGATWTALAGSIADPTEANGINGTQAAYAPATFDLSAYAGQTVTLKFTGTEGSTKQTSFVVDDAALNVG